MNRLSYRIVFNAIRGQLVAVAESATSQGKGCGERAGRQSARRLRQLRHTLKQVGSLSALALAAWLTTLPAALAQIIADPTAPANQRPTVLPGLLVNIQTPSAAGVSRNTYSRFDVGFSDTVILNNNRFSNPWLATGSARVILNEINSSNPSYLGGQIMVEGVPPGGGRADVVFANPSGINVNGVSFFGAGRVTLTTGAPVMVGGALSGFDVTRGNVEVGSMGMGVNGAGSFAEIISRSAVIGGMVRADQSINVTTGPQTVDYATGTTTPLAGTGAQPTLAIDTKALGGMYAGSITLLSTEAGVGVRNQGTLQANTGSGQLIVTADGRLENTGRMDAAYTSVATVAGNIDNSGNLLGRQLLLASAGGDFNHTGAGLAQNETATSPLTDPWHTAYNIGSGMAQDAGSASQVFINAKQDVNLIYNASGSRIASDASVTAADGTVTKGQVVISAGRNVGLQAATAVSANGAVQISSDGNVYGSWNSVSSGSDSATVLAKNGIALSGSTVTGNRVHLETGAAFEETASHISIAGGQINGTQQTAMIASGNLNINTAGASGVGSSAGHAYLTAGGNLSIAAGTSISTAGHFAAKADSLQLQGTSGVTADSNKIVSISTGGDATLSAGSIDINGSALRSGGSISIEASKADVLIQALPDQGLDTHAVMSLNNSSCCASSQMQTAATNTAALLEAASDLSISAYGGSIRTKGLQATGQDINIISNGATQIDRVERITQTKIGGPLESKIGARGDLTIASIHDNGTVEITGATLTATGNARVIGNAAVNLSSTATSHTFSNGQMVTTLARSGISGSSVVVQGGAVLAEGLQIDAKNGYVSLGATTGGIKLDFGGMTYTTINASGNIAIQANDGVVANYVRANAGNNLAVTSATTGVTVSGSVLTSKNMLSVSSKGSQTHTGSQYAGDALSFYNASGMQSLANTQLQAKGIPISDGQSVSGKLSIESGEGITADGGTRFVAGSDLAIVTNAGNITIAPDRASSANSGLLLAQDQIQAGRDISIGALGGELKMEGRAGSAGNLTAKVVTLASKRDLNLVGASVQLQAPKISAAQNLNVTSLGGGILIDGVKSIFTSYAPTAKIAELQTISSQLALDLVALNDPKLVAHVGTASSSTPVCKTGSVCVVAETLAQKRARITAEKAQVDKLISTLKAKVKGAEHVGATISGQNINITSASAIAAYGAEIIASGNVGLKSSGAFNYDTELPTESQKPVGTLIAGLSDFYEYGTAGSSNHVFALMSKPTVISGQAGVSIQAMGSDANARLIINDSAVKSSLGTVHLQSLGDMALEAGQEEFYSESIKTYTRKSWGGLKKKTTTETTTSRYIDASPVVLDAQNITLKSGGSIEAEAAEFLAPQGNIQITAANALNLYAVDTLNTSTFNAKTRSSFLGITYKKSTSTSSRTVSDKLPSKLVASMVNTASGWNTLLQGTTIQTSLAGANIAAGVGDNARADAQVILESIKKTVTESKTKESNYVVWQRQLGSGSTVETMTLPSFTGPTPPVFSAPGGLTVQVPAGEFTSQIQTLSQQPGMSYLNELTLRKDVNWQPVKLAFDQWSYKQEGLTPAGAALLGVAVAWATGGMGSELLGIEGGLGAKVADAAFMSLASQASITFVNNKGNIGKTLSDLAKSDIVKATLAAALTAGVLDKIGALDGMQSLKQSTVFTDKLTYNLVNAGGRALTNTAINGGNLEDALKQALVGGLVDTAQGEVASQIKVLEGEYLAHKLAHALAGCVAGVAANGTCRDGAIGAAVGEVVAEMFDGQKPGAYASTAEIDAYNQKVLGYSKLVAGAVSAYAGGNAQTAITTAETAVLNNFLTFNENQLRKQAAEACKAGNTQACADEKRWDQLDVSRDDKVRQLCTSAPASQECTDWRNFALLAKSSYSGATYGRDAVLDMIKSGQYSDAQEVQSIQRLLSSTPYAYGKDMTLPPHLKSLAGIVADLTPIVGDAKAFYEAKDPFDYALAVVGALGPVGDGAAAAIRAAKAAHQAGNATEAARQLQAAERIAQNAVNGRVFEGSGLQAMGLDKNKDRITAVSRNGESITIVPDATIGGLKGTYVEFKNVINITDSSQFRGYAATGQPIVLVVSSRTQTISPTVWDMVRASGDNAGYVVRFDPATGARTILQKRPGA